MRTAIVCVVVASVAVSLFQIPASATDGTWTGTVNSSWSTTGNWLNGVPASGKGAMAVFAISSGGGPQINQNVADLTLGSISNVSSVNVTIYGNAIGFDNNSVSPLIASANNYLYLRASLTNAGRMPLVKSGSSTITFTPDSGTNSFDCGLTVNQGNLEVASTRNGLPLGTSNITLNGSSALRLSKGGYSYAAVTNSTATFAFSDTPSVYMVTGVTAATTLTLGDPGAPANSVLRRDNKGVLNLDSSTHALGGGAKIFVNGGVAVSNGVACLPMIIAANGGDCDGSFLTYNDSAGLTNADQTANGVTNGAATIGSITNNTTLSTNATVCALRVVVSAACRDVVFTIASGCTLTVGDGVNPTVLLLGYDYNFHHGSISGGTLNFGASEGIISFGGTCNANTAWPGISSVIAGSGGVTFANRVAGYFAFYNNNTYTGPTHLLMGSVVPFGTLTRPFSGDDLYIHGSSIGGGQLQFGQLIGAITNRVHASGVGVAMSWRNAYKLPTGAIIFSGIGTNSGPVELAGDVRLSAPGSTNNYGLISGPISGNYGIEIGYTNRYANEQFGTVKFSGTNTYTGSTSVSGGALELLTARSLGSGPVIVTTNLVFNFAGNATFTNAVSGNGNLVQKGGGRIRLSNAKAFTGQVVNQSGTIVLGASNATAIYFR